MARCIGRQRVCRPQSGNRREDRRRRRRNARRRRRRCNRCPPRVRRKWPTMAASRRAKIVYKMALADRRARVGDRAARSARQRQDDSDGQRRDRRDRGLLRVLRGRGDKKLRRDVAAADSHLHGLYAPRARRRSRRDRSLEFSAAARIVEGCSRARCRLLRRPQAVVGDAADSDRTRQDRDRSRPPRRRAQHRHRCVASDRCVDGRASGDRQDCFHRIHRDRQARRRRRRADPQARDARAGRQIAVADLRRRRSRCGRGRSAVRRVL